MLTVEVLGGTLVEVRAMFSHTQLRSKLSVGAAVALSVLLCALAAAAAVSAAAASEPTKRYTFPAGPLSLVYPGTMTVLLPAAWQVSTEGKTLLVDANDPVHRSHGWPWIRVHWWVTTRLEAPVTTLAGIRERMVIPGGRQLGPNGSGVYQVGDAFLKLPVGKVWRQSLEIVQPKASGGWDARDYMRIYTLDRGLVTDGKTGATKRLFLEFRIACGHDQCAAHTAQLNAIMHSIRLTD